MFIFLSSTCLQNFSDWHALFVFLLHSVAAAAWSGIMFSPADDPFWAFLSPDAQQPVQPQTIFVWLGSWKKYVLGIHPKKDNHPGPLPQQGFCTSLQIWDELGVTWQTKQRFFFPSQGPLILNVVNSLSWPFLDLACYLCESFLVESPIL